MSPAPTCTPSLPTEVRHSHGKEVGWESQPSCPSCYPPPPSQLPVWQLPQSPVLVETLLARAWNTHSCYHVLQHVLSAVDFSFHLIPSAFSSFRNSSKKSCPCRACSAVTNFFLMYLLSFLDARHMDRHGETEVCQPFLGRCFAITLKLWTP